MSEQPFEAPFEYSMLPEIRCRPPLNDDVHVWNISLNEIEARRAYFAHLLSHDEQLRAARFRFAEDSTRFVLVHGALREILSSYARIPAAQLHFEQNRFGKPFLSHNSEHDLKFNLSYRKGRALFAVSRGHEIGIDIEQSGFALDVRTMSEFVCSSTEKCALGKLPDEEQTGAFLRLWVRKEAALKAMGRGFSFDARQLEIGLAPEPSVFEIVCHQEEQRWLVRDLWCGGDYNAAIALQDVDLTLHFQSYPASFPSLTTTSFW
ncbi:MAG TPA: 4'-phosphopantetheinyl transferase superfamily protein [Abditibacteriaceae bacterium]|jgi:4'-phosphopantetheinyl transferase|nr:4'-phosphopantetheinyl transferase superfamily protein [Abditibacteriaceae bacterium]